MLIWVVDYQPKGTWLHHNLSCLLHWSTTSMMNGYAGCKWTTLTNTTSHYPKHFTINILNECIKVKPLNWILSSELEGSFLEEQCLLEFLFPDSMLGFSVNKATAYLNQLSAFAHATSMLMPGNHSEFFFHNTVRCQINNKATMANHLKHITKALNHHYPNLRLTWEWTSQNCSNPMPATHFHKPDLALCDTIVLEGQKEGLLSSWSIMHSIIEIKKQNSAKVPLLIVNTIGVVCVGTPTLVVTWSAS